MKKHLLNLALLFIALNAAAQSNYQSGYVIKNKSDTQKGFINARDQSATPTYIEFKVSKEDKEPTRFNPADVKGFTVFSYFSDISYTGKLSQNKNMYPNIDVEMDTTSTYASVFLQKVASGPNASLYVNTDELKIRYFIKGKDSQPVELLYYEYGNASEKPAKSSVFLGQLIEIYTRYNGTDDNKISNLQRTIFTQASLEDALALINKNVTDKKTSPSNSKFFFGASVANVQSTATDLLDQGISAKSTNISPKIDLGFDIVNNPEAQKFILRLEFAFLYLKPAYVFSYSPNGINTIPNNTYGFTQYSLALTPQFIYNIYSTVGFKFFVGAGVSMNYSNFQNNVITYYSITSFAPYTLRSNTEDGSTYASNISFNFPLQTGVVLNKHIELSINYSPNFVVASKLKYQSIGAGINYLF